MGDRQGGNLPLGADLANRFPATFSVRVIFLIAKKAALFAPEFEQTGAVRADVAALK